MDNNFPSIYIVSLSDAVERREHIVRQISKFPHLRWNFFDAIRIKSRSEYPDDYNVASRRFLFGDDLRPGEVGCFLSHRELWRRCAESSESAWCILEDDIIINDNFEQCIKFLMQHSHEWDVVRLMQLLERKRSRTHITLNEQYILRAYDRQPSGTQGYLIKSIAARKLAEHAADIVWPIDETLDLYWEHRQRLYCVAPSAIGTCPDFDSLIGQRSNKNRPKWRKLQRQLINGLQGIKRMKYRFFNY